MRYVFALCLALLVFSGCTLFSDPFESLIDAIQDDDVDKAWARVSKDARDESLTDEERQRSLIEFRDRWSAHDVGHYLEQARKYLAAPGDANKLSEKCHEVDGLEKCKIVYEYIYADPETSPKEGFTTAPYVRTLSKMKIAVVAHDDLVDIESMDKISYFDGYDIEQHASNAKKESQLTKKQLEDALFVHFSGSSASYRSYQSGGYWQHSKDGSTSTYVPESTGSYFDGEHIGFYALNKLGARPLNVTIGYRFRTNGSEDSNFICEPRDYEGAISSTVYPLVERYVSDKIDTRTNCEPKNFLAALGGLISAMTGGVAAHVDEGSLQFSIINIE